MAIVEIVNAYGGYQIVTNKIYTTKKVFLLLSGFCVGLLTFFLSSVLNNLFTTIISLSLLRSIIKAKEDC